MRRGPKPKPTRLKVIAGNPGKRPLPEDEPQPNPGMPAVPSHVKGEALKEWKRMSVRLQKLGVLTEVDGPALAAYCCAWERLQRIETELRKSGLTEQTEKGRTMRNPLVEMANSTSVVVNRWLSEFGLTPASRTRVKATRQIQDDGDGFLDSA